MAADLRERIAKALARRRFKDESVWQGYLPHADAVLAELAELGLTQAEAVAWRCTGDEVRCFDGNGCECAMRGKAPPTADAALADTQRAIIEAAERRGYERGLREAPPAAVPADTHGDEFGRGWNACREAMLAAANKETTND